MDLAAWDLFADARWAAAARRQHALADEAARSAQHYAHMDKQGMLQVPPHREGAKPCHEYPIEWYYEGS